MSLPTRQRLALDAVTFDEVREVAAGIRTDSLGCLRWPPYSRGVPDCVGSGRELALGFAARAAWEPFRGGRPSLEPGRTQVSRRRDRGNFRRAKPSLAATRLWWSHPTARLDLPLRCTATDQGTIRSGRVGLLVEDVSPGTSLYSRKATVARPPASVE